MRQKYAIVSEPVESKYDGEIHIVPCSELARLYGVSPGECLYIPWDYPGRGHLIWEAEEKDLTFLYPDYDGNYNLPKEAEYGTPH